MKCLFILILFLSSLVLQAQIDETKNREFYNKPSSVSIYLEAFNNSELKDLEVYMINKLMLKVSSRQQKYGTIVSSSQIIDQLSKEKKIEIELFKLQIKFQKDKNGLFLWSGQFVKINDNKNKVEEKIYFSDPNQVIWNAEVLLERLFLKFDKWYESKSLENEAPKAESAFQTFEKQKQTPEVKHDSGINAFRQKILSLKLGVQDKLTKMQEKTKEKPSGGGGAGELAQSNKTSFLPEDSKKDKIELKPEPVKPSSGANYFSKISLNIGYEQQSTDVTDNIETNTPLKFFFLGAQYSRALDLKHQRGFVINGKYKTNFAKLDDPVKPQVEVQTYLYQRILRSNFIGLGVHRRVLAFNNLPEQYQGIKAGAITTNFYDISWKSQLEKFSFALHYGGLLGYSTEYSTLSGAKAKGSQLSLISACDKLFYNIDLMLGVHILSFSASDISNREGEFTLKSTAINFMASYDF